MKKKVAMLFGVVMCSVMCGVMLAGCGDMLAPGGELGGPGGPGGEEPAEKTELEVIAEKYGKITEAASIGQEIEITRGELLQFESEKTYKKAGTGYQVTGHEKRLNSLTSGSEEPYTETAIETTVQGGTFTVRLELNELYFSAVAIENGTLEATVLDSSVETVLGLTEELPLSSQPHGMTLKIVTDETHVTGIEIAYKSGASEVAIGLEFVYEGAGA